MTSPLEYHVFVRHSIPASVALFLSLLALPLLILCDSQAQTNGTPTSATSQGFGGSHPITAPFPSGGTLPGHQVQAQAPRVGFSTLKASSGDDRHHHNHEHPAVIYAVPVPYAVDLAPSVNDSDAETDDSDANYQGGPTIFDRRGTGADSYVPPERNLRAPHSVENASSDPAPQAPQEPTVLVFKNGRKLEVGNYAIVGATLFDLTAGHSRKVALADLDLEATQRENGDRGVNFQIPQLPQAN
jgi:hypothetical protein